MAAPTLRILSFIEQGQDLAGTGAKRVENGNEAKVALLLKSE